MDFRYIRWIVSHVDEIEAILDAVQTALAAPTWPARLAALRPILSLIGDIMVDFPSSGGFGAAITEETDPEYVANTRAMAEGRGINWERIQRIIELAEKLAPFILLFMGPKPQQPE